MGGVPDGLQDRHSLGLFAADARDAKPNITMGPIIQFWISENPRILQSRNTSPSSS